MLEPTRPLPTLLPRLRGTASPERKQSRPAPPNICDGNFNTVAVFRREMFVFKVSEERRELIGREALLPGRLAGLRDLLLVAVRGLMCVRAVVCRR